MINQDIQELTKMENMEKSRVVKYIRRIPKPSGKGFYYFYTRQAFEHYQKTGDPGKQESHHGFFAAIKDFFGIQDDKQLTEKFKKDYSDNGIEKKFGINFHRWVDHLSEYFTNKESYDEMFNRKKAEAEKKKAEAIASGNPAPSTTSDDKKKIKSTNNLFEYSVMRYIFNSYNGIKPQSIPQGGQSGKDTIGTGRSELSGNKQEIHGKGNSGHSLRNVPEEQPTNNGEKLIQPGVNTGIGSSGDVLVRVGKSTAKKIRENCLKLLESKKDNEMTDEDKALLRQYEGAGGLGEEKQDSKAVLSAFYTPTKVVNKMWDIVNKYLTGVTGKIDVLEPSAGTGRFMENHPEYNYDAIEIDKTSARINRILHPEANIIEGAFQKLFFDKETGRLRQKMYNGKKYDVVIGNPPYMKYDSEQWWGEGDKHTRYEEYFIDRGLDTLKDGGIMAFIVPSSFMRKWNNSEVKAKIAEKGKLMEGWRLPNGTFSSTGEGTDILIIRKEKGNVNDFLGDDFFVNNPQNVLGDEVVKKDQYGKPCKYIQTKDGQTFDQALDSIDVTKHDVPQIGRPPMSEQQKQNIGASLHGNKNAKKDIKAEPKKKEAAAVSVKKEVQSAEEFNSRYNRKVTEHELDAWKATRYDGSIEIDKVPAKSVKALQNAGELFKMEGKFYHKKNYVSGDIYGKLDILEQEHLSGSITEKEYEVQKGLLEKATPAMKTVKDITVSPLSQFAREFTFLPEDGKGVSLIDRFWQWAGVAGYRKQYQDFNAGVTKKDIPLNATWADIVDYIEGVPVRAKGSSSEATKAENAIEAGRKKEQRREAGEKIFKRFIEQGLNIDERTELEAVWNRRFNGNVEPDYKSIPVFVNGISTTFKGKELEVKDIQLKGAAFLGNKGNGVLAYDVGVGKTLTGILATVQQLQMGRCKAPVICVPTAVYENWKNEIRDLFPDIKINELGNLGKEYADKVPKGADGKFDLTGAVNIMSYEALKNITFKDETINGELFQDMMASQARESDEIKSKRQEASEMESIRSKLGTATKVKDQVFFMEDLGIDHITIDEVHNDKNIFGGAKAPLKFNSRGQGEQQANEFQSLSGGSSDQGIKTFAIAQYIQSKNNGKNVFALSATPFTNSPVEVYNILSLVARDRLKELGIYNMHEFMAQFASLQGEWAVLSKGTIERKAVMKSFQNLKALQNLLHEYIDKVDGEAAGVKRPDKVVHQIKLPMTRLQELLMQAEQQRMAKKSKENPAGAIVGINKTRQSTLSPLLVELDDFHDAEIHAEMKKARAMGFVESSPKLEFTFGSVAAVHKKRPDIGQVVYMPQGNKHYSDCIDYLVKNGFKRDEVAVIEGGVSGKKREMIMKEFNDPKGKIKVIIGSEAIQEGVNLNGNTAVEYNTLLGWNASETTQVEGRVWRQGNKQKKVHMAYPQMVNSIDAAMYQKHDEKRSRFEALWTAEGNEINVEDIKPEELKFELIKDPERRAKFKIELEQEKLAGTLKDYEINIETLSKFKTEYESMKYNVEYYGSRMAKSQIDLTEKKTRLAEAKKSKNEDAIADAEWYVKDVQGDYDTYKTGFKKAEKRIEAIETTLKQMGNIKVSDIDNEVAERTVQKETLEQQIKDIGEKKAEYVENERRAMMEAQAEKIPTIQESINDFSESVLANLESESELQKALANIGVNVILKRLNSETGLFEYRRMVK